MVLVYTPYPHAVPCVMFTVAEGNNSPNTMSHLRHRLMWNNIQTSEGSDKFP